CSGAVFAFVLAAAGLRFCSQTMPREPSAMRTTVVWLTVGEAATVVRVAVPAFSAAMRPLATAGCGCGAWSAQLFDTAAGADTIRPARIASDCLRMNDAPRVAAPNLARDRVKVR